MKFPFMYGTERMKKMAYNNFFPAGYQYYQQQAYQPPQGQITQNNGIIWVQGEAGAKSYLVAPNNTVQLWDSEAQTIYLKSADASGMPSLKILDYKIRNQEQAQAILPVNEDNKNYVTLDEFNVIKSELIALKNEMTKIKEAKHESKHDE